jgi:hypothetical protein
MQIRVAILYAASALAIGNNPAQSARRDKLKLSGDELGRYQTLLSFWWNARHNLAVYDADKLIKSDDIEKVDGVFVPKSRLAEYAQDDSLADEQYYALMDYWQKRANKEIKSSDEPKALIKDHLEKHSVKGFMGSA